MKQELRITHGTEVLWLSKAGINLSMRYIPLAPETKATEVSDSVEVVFNTLTSRDRDLLQSVNRLFELARHWQAIHVGDPVYLEFKPDYSDTDFYRSEIMDGKVVLSTGSAGMRLSNGVIEAMIAWTRKPYWEGPDTQVLLADATHTRSTSPIIVHNPTVSIGSDTSIHISFVNPHHVVDTAHGLPADLVVGDVLVVSNSANDDGVYHVTSIGTPTDDCYVAETLVGEAAGANLTIDVFRHENYVDIAAQDVEGDLPTPARIEFTNGYNATNDRPKEIYIAHNVFNSPANLLIHILEGETGCFAPVSVPDVDANSSLGMYGFSEWMGTAWTDLFSWSLSTDQLNIMRGNYFRVLVRMVGRIGYTDLWLKVRVYTTTLVWESEPVLAPFGLRLFELATVALPPFRVGSYSNAAITMVISGYRNSAGPHQCNVDYFQLSPMDGWRVFIPNPVQVGGPLFTQRVVDDEILNLIYIDDGAGNDKVYSYYTSSAPIMLVPNQNQRLYFLMRTGVIDNYGSLIEMFGDVMVWYRPRRSTV